MFLHLRHTEVKAKGAESCARVSVSTFAVHAPFLMSSVKSLDTLWSLVCAKGGGGGGGECPRKEVQRSVKPFGRTVEGCKSKRTHEGSEEGD